MKRLIALALCALLLTAGAAAEERITLEDEATQTMRDGRTLRVTAVTVWDGEEPLQTLRLIADLAPLDESFAKLEDVNFDGLDDLVWLAGMGTSNVWYSFYLRNAQTGAFEGGQAEPVDNYTLDPGRALVIAFLNNGGAGLYHEKRVYDWGEDGRTLRLLRSVRWETPAEESYDLSDPARMVVTQTISEGLIAETCTDHLTGETYTQTFEADRYAQDAFFREREDAENAFLGL